MAAVLVVAVVGVVQCRLTVVTQGGRIKGKAETSINGRPFRSFYGIPYARAPIGALRFKVSTTPGSVQPFAY